MSATVHTSELPPIGVIGPPPQMPGEHTEAPEGGPPQPPPGALEAPHQARADSARERPLSEQPTAVLVSRIARLEGSLGAALSLLRRCIVERKTPTREALAAEAGFALGMPPQAALAELDQIAQIVGVSSLR